MYQNRGAFRLELLESRRLPSVGPAAVVAGSIDLDTHAHEEHGAGCISHLLDPTARRAQSVLNASSPQVLFLDFDGATVTSNPCGFAYQTPYQVASFDLSPLGFGGQEATAKNYILQFVEGDYAAYNVTVTTTQPTSGPYSTVFMDDFSFEGGGILGVACYDVGNFSHTDFGFVFVQQFGSYASGRDLFTFSQYLANTVSHEAGHVFGLDHITGANIMQPALNFNPVKIGFASGSNEDSQAVLAANLGYRDGVSDDFGDTTVDASALSLN